MSAPTSSGSTRECLPEVNDLVRVSIAGSGPVCDGDTADGVRTRVENVEPAEGGRVGRRYVIAAPRYQGDLELPVAGTPCTLEWPGTQGVWILPVAFVGESVARQEGLRVWTLDTIGAPRQNERRSFVRVDWSVPVTLTLMSAADVRAVAAARGLDQATMASAPSIGPALPDQLSGETENISEGGIRTLLPGPLLPTGLGVAVHLELSGERFTIASRVSWVRHTGLIGPVPFDTAVAFDNPAVQGDRLRPLLFAEQLRIRRAGLA